MAVVTLPTTLPLGVGSGLGQQRFDLVATSESTGSQQTRVLAPPRWTLTLVQQPNVALAQAGAWQALLTSLRGRVNHLLAGDPIRIAPLGSMRGTPTLSSTAALGATSLVLATGQANCTLRAGDWLQLGTGLGTSQLVMCTADAVANGTGVMTVATEAPLRLQFAAGTGVAWSRASAYFKQTTDAATWRYGDGGAALSGMSLDLMEAWT